MPQPPKPGSTVQKPLEPSQPIPPPSESENAANETLEALLQRLEIPPDWSLILIGDGSGSQWGFPVGFACVAIEAQSMERKVFYGAMNDGTVNVAELMAYLAPLSWYLKRVRELPAVAVRHVHIITDSQYVHGRGQQSGNITQIKNSILWGAFELLRRQGLALHWHWVRREEVELNRFADRLSKLSRVELNQIDTSQIGLDPHALNPRE